MSSDVARGLLSGAPALRYVTGWRQPFEPGSCPWHVHPSLEIAFHPVTGGVTSTQGGLSIEFDSGSAVIYPPGVSHIQSSDRAGEDWCVHTIAGENSTFVLPDTLHISNLKDPQFISEIEALTRLAPIIDDLDQAVLDHRVTALMIRLLKSEAAQANATEDAAHAYCRKAVNFIHAHYQEIGQLTDVAEHVGISYHHLRHCFSRIQKQSLSNYVTWVRLERARAILLHSQLPLADIARATGFANERYFSTCFRKATGSAPGSYRIRMRGAGALPPEALATIAPKPIVRQQR